MGLKLDDLVLKKNFFEAAKRGTGEAYLIIRDHPKIDFSKELIKVCIKNYAYNGQCESSRAPYLFNLIALSNKQEKIKSRIIQRLAVEDRDTWTLVQLFDLAKIFAQNGSNDAREAIYNRYLTKPVNGSDWAGYAQIVELDGLKGLFYFAEKLGRAIESNPSDFFDDYFIDRFQKNNPDINLIEKLESAAETNHYIRLFLKAAKPGINHRENYKREIKVFENPVDEVLNTKSKLRLISKNWTENELVEIALQLEIEKKTKSKTQLLLPFIKNIFPGYPESIIDIAKKHNSKKSIIGNRAISVLENIQSEKVREFALERIKIDKYPYRFAGILTSNYKADDYKMLVSLIENTSNENIIEDLARHFTSIFYYNSTSECLAPLELLYAKMTCSIHRETVIQILLENGVLSEKIKHEIDFDCNKEIQELLIRKT